MDWFKGRGECIVEFRVGSCLRFSTAFQNRVCGWKVIKIATLVFFFAAHITTENGHFKISTTTASISTKFCADKTVFGEEQ